MSSGGPRILLVDDEPGLLEVCAETLSGLASSITMARDGLEALEHLRSASFDLIVSDLNMPGGGGLELIRKVSGMAPGTDVMVLTGYGTIESAVECVRLGAVNYLLKPFKLEALRAAVAKALEERSLRLTQVGTGNLAHMLALSSALTGKEDVKALIKEFLGQVRQAFAPDGIAFFFDDSRGGGVGQQILVGPYFRDNPGVRTWFETLASSIASKGRPMLLEEGLLREAFAKSAGSGRMPRSAIGAAVSGATSAVSANGAMGSARGAVVALRAGDGPPYGLGELKLLTLFAAHASLCFESQRACAKLKTVNDEIVFSLVHAVEAKDTYTRGHSERVSRYAAKLAAFLGMSVAEVELVRVAGILHDIGKIGVPDAILNKPGALTPQELGPMRQHPVIAQTILGKVESLSEALPVVFHHHERFDGSGYPDGLAGQEIPFLARLVSVVDGFEAMTSDRAYHKRRSVEEARDILRKGSGTQWDPEIISAWLALLDEGRAI